MANWKEALDISDLHDSYKEESISVEDLVKEVQKRCLRLKCSKDETFKSLINQLEGIEDVHDYDSVLNCMYTYGDINNRLWIRAF